MGSSRGFLFNLCFSVEMHLAEETEGRCPILTNMFEIDLNYIDHFNYHLFVNGSCATIRNWKNVFMNIIYEVVDSSFGFLYDSIFL